MKMSIFFAESFKEHTEEEIKAIMIRIMFLMKRAGLIKSNMDSKFGSENDYQLERDEYSL